MYASIHPACVIPQNQIPSVISSSSRKVLLWHSTYQLCTLTVTMTVMLTVTPTRKQGLIAIDMRSVQAQIWRLQPEYELHLVQLLQLLGLEDVHHGWGQAAHLLEEGARQVAPDCQSPGSVCQSLQDRDWSVLCYKWVSSVTAKPQAVFASPCRTGIDDCCVIKGSFQS